MLNLFNSLVSGRCGCYLKLIIFKLIWRIDISSISCEIALKWMPQDLTDGKSTLVLVMAGCRQATSHYPNQCWPCVVTRGQWVESYENTLAIISQYSRGGWFNIKISSFQYRKSHCGDKMVVRSSYLHNGVSYTDKTPSLYWTRAQVLETLPCGRQEPLYPT